MGVVETAGAVLNLGRSVRTIPVSFLSHSDVAGNGERFWFRAVAGDVARWLAREGLAIVGGEVYRRHSTAWGTYIGGWATVVPENASWESRVERCLRRALDAVSEDPADWAEFPGIPTELLYFYALASPPE